MRFLFVPIKSKSSKFGSSKTTTVDAAEDEIVSIKKRDYETLLSRVNQLTEQMNKLKKK